MEGDLGPAEVSSLSGDEWMAQAPDYLVNAQDQADHAAGTFDFDVADVDRRSMQISRAQALSTTFQLADSDGDGTVETIVAGDHLHFRAYVNNNPELKALAGEGSAVDLDNLASYANRMSTSVTRAWHTEVTLPDGSITTIGEMYVDEYLGGAQAGDDILLARHQQLDADIDTAAATIGALNVDGTIDGGSTDLHLAVIVKSSSGKEDIDLSTMSATAGVDRRVLAAISVVESPYASSVRFECTKSNVAGFDSEYCRQEGGSRAHTGISNRVSVVREFITAHPDMAKEIILNTSFGMGQVLGGSGAAEYFAEQELTRLGLAPAGINMYDQLVAEELRRLTAAGTTAPTVTFRPRDTDGDGTADLDTRTYTLEELAQHNVATRMLDWFEEDAATHSTALVGEWWAGSAKGRRTTASANNLGALIGTIEARGTAATAGEQEQIDILSYDVASNYNGPAFWRNKSALAKAGILTGTATTGYHWNPDAFAGGRVPPEVAAISLSGRSNYFNFTGFPLLDGTATVGDGDRDTMLSFESLIEPDYLAHWEGTRYDTKMLGFMRGELYMCVSGCAGAPRWPAPSAAVYDWYAPPTGDRHLGHVAQMRDVPTGVQDPSTTITISRQELRTAFNEARIGYPTITVQQVLDYLVAEKRAALPSPPPHRDDIYENKRRLRNSIRKVLNEQLGQGANLRNAIRKVLNEQVAQDPRLGQRLGQRVRQAIAPPTGRGTYYGTSGPGAGDTSARARMYRARDQLAGLGVVDREAEGRDVANQLSMASDNLASALTNARTQITDEQAQQLADAERVLSWFQTYGPGLQPMNAENPPPSSEELERAAAILRLQPDFKERVQAVRDDMEQNLYDGIMMPYGLRSSITADAAAETWTRSGPSRSITSPTNPSRWSTTAERYRDHEGVDLRAAEGTAQRSPVSDLPMTLLRAGYSGGMGNYVEYQVGTIDDPVRFQGETHEQAQQRYRDGRAPKYRLFHNVGYSADGSTGCAFGSEGCYIHPPVMGENGELQVVPNPQIGDVADADAILAYSGDTGGGLHAQGIDDPLHLHEPIEHGATARTDVYPHHQHAEFDVEGDDSRESIMRGGMLMMGEETANQFSSDISTGDGRSNVVRDYQRAGMGDWIDFYGTSPQTGEKRQGILHGGSFTDDPMTRGRDAEARLAWLTQDDAPETDDTGMRIPAVPMQSYDFLTGMDTSHRIIPSDLPGGEGRWHRTDDNAWELEHPEIEPPEPEAPEEEPIAAVTDPARRNHYGDLRRAIREALKINLSSNSGTSTKSDLGDFSNLDDTNISHDEAFSAGCVVCGNVHDSSEKCELPTLQESYIQNVYSAECGLNIHKQKGGNRDQTLTDIRGIPGVTIVSVVPGTTRDLPHTFITDLSIKFQLNRNLPPRNYVKRTLIPGMQKIPGISNFQVKTIEPISQVEDEV